MALLLGASLAGAKAADVSLAWDPSQDPKVVGFRLHWGQASRTYSTNRNLGTATTATVTGLTNGATYFFAATAYDAAGLQSEYSNEVEYTPPLGQSAPIARDLKLAVAEGGAIAFSLEATDADGDALHYTVVVGPMAGVLTGTAPNLTYRPNAGFTGEDRISYKAADANAESNLAIVAFTVVPVNDPPPPPTVSYIPDSAADEDESTGPIPFTIGSRDHDLDTLVLAAASSDDGLVPAGHIVFGGSGANRTITVTPAANQHGTATISLQVSDGAAVTDRTFRLVVHPVNDPPKISRIPDLEADLGAAIPPVGFQVKDVDNLFGSLTLTATSSDPSLLAGEDLVFEGEGESRTVTLPPAANRPGSATVTITVSDGALSDQSTFVIRFGGAVPPPWLSADVGSPELAGSTTYAQGAFSIQGSGADLTGSSDQFHFLYQTLSGDGEIAVRVASIEEVLRFPISAVVARSTLNPESPSISLSLTPNARILQWRSSPGVSSLYWDASPWNLPPDNWIRLRRTGAVFQAFYSADGTDWTQIGPCLVFDLPSELYIGLAVTSNDPTRLTTSTVDNVTVVP